jgi:DNA invertase Pin-like site-specific DNA recombinase
MTIDMARSGASIDTTSSEGKVIFNIIASLADFEHDLLIEQT